MKCVDNFVDSRAAPGPQPWKIKGLAGMHGKMARHEMLMNQRLSAAIGFVAITSAARRPQRAFCA
jgi:hypothetical protein